MPVLLIIMIKMDFVFNATINVTTVLMDLLVKNVKIILTQNSEMSKKIVPVKMVISIIIQTVQ
jgi:formylmethanofuran dehydrogenase subunit A